MSGIMKRITIRMEGTPQHVADAMSGRLPEGVPSDAVIVEVDVRTYSEAAFLGYSRVSTSLALTLEWPS